MSEESKRSLASYFNLEDAPEKEGDTVDFQKEQPEKQEPPKQEPAKQEPQKEQAKQEDPFDAWRQAPEFKNLAELIEAQEGENLSEKINKFKATYEERTSKFEEFQQKEQEREEWFRQNKILESQEFKEKFEAPLRKHLDIFTGLLSEVDEDGKVKRDDIYMKLREHIINDGKDISSAQIKALFKSFSTQYKNKFGVEPDLPSIRDVIDSRSSLIEAAAKRNQAVQQWEELRQQDEENRKKQEREYKQTVTQNLVAEVKQKHKEWLKTVELDELEKFADKDTLIDAANEVRSETEQRVTAEDGDVAEYFPIAFKARLFDKLLEEHNKLKDYVEKRNKGVAASAPGVTPPPGKEDQREQHSESLIEYFKL